MRQGQQTFTKVAARWDGLIGILAVAVILGVVLAPPHGLLHKADRAAYAVCHQLPERTFTIAGRPLPLCARCSGTYLGTLAGLAVLVVRGRGRACRLPAPRYLAIFAGFLAAWALDGLNSFDTFFPGLPYLYEPNNLLRLTTGMLEGLAIAAVALPSFNLALWADPEPRSSVDCWQDLLWMIMGGAVVVALISSGWSLLLAPLALSSALAVVLLVGAVNAMVIPPAMHRDGRITSWREAASPLLVGMALGVLELAAIGMARALLLGWLGSPL
jgi:uncharacterized membrane protein